MAVFPAGERCLGECGNAGMRECINARMRECENARMLEERILAFHPPSGLSLGGIEAHRRERRLFRLVDEAKLGFEFFHVIRQCPHQAFGVLGR